MPFINSLIEWLIKKRIHQIDLFIKYPHEVQNDLFVKLLNAGRQTEWGKKQGFDTIRTYEDYAQQVPVQDYETLKPFIEEIRLGKQNILWNTEIRWFAKSSGTTADKSKYIPVSFEALEECHYKAGKDMLAIYCNNYPDNHIFDGMSLAMGGSGTLREVNNTELMEGDLSAILMHNLPWWAELRRTPQLSVALMEEWESKIDTMAHLTLKEDITSITGVPSWTLVLLRKILEISGKSHIIEVWPRLEVFFHGGVSFKPYRRQFENLIPSAQMHYMETYNASEGFFAIQDDPGDESMLLMLDYGIFYEFIPFEEFVEGKLKPIPLWKVETGKNYAMVITTNGGLWRYLLGDTVMFTSCNPYKIRITGRTRHFINAFGEEVIADNVEKALSIACDKCNAIIEEYTGAPRYFGDSGRGAHEWIMEFSAPPTSIDYFAEIFDNALKSVNSDYEAKRYKNMVLEPPVLHIVTRGTFYKWMKHRNKLGGQNKVPRLANERKFVEEILSLIQNNELIEN
ncbi:MAG: GH3 auxin-responsive promoter family protein [Bacteroidales bacterium]|jgi:hypothetical protein|nr:GH3 auxin-responsive promoter family protein [Bacteroidales bacterium]